MNSMSDGWGSMCKAFLDNNPSDAPCCRKLVLEPTYPQREMYEIPRHATLSILYQQDWDWPSLARMFGWAPCHDVTDGTVDCSICGKTASTMIAEASEWLDDHDGCSCEVDLDYYDTESLIEE